MSAQEAHQDLDNLETISSLGVELLTELHFLDVSISQIPVATHQDQLDHTWFMEAHRQLTEMVLRLLRASDSFLTANFGNPSTNHEQRPAEILSPGPRTFPVLRWATSATDSKKSLKRSYISDEEWRCYKRQKTEPTE